jgi:predicted kinase
MLIAFCGRPRAGKTMPAHRLAQQRQATYLRIDAVAEALLADRGSRLVDRGAGYRVAYAIAEENLKLGRTVFADCVNPLKITREAWCAVARRAAVELITVVVTCSNPAQPQSRVEAHPPGTRGSVWAGIRNRAFEATQPSSVVIDTADRSVEQCLAALDAAVLHQP